MGFAALNPSYDSPSMTAERYPTVTMPLQN
jgi:hypothetical protein